MQKGFPSPYGDFVFQQERKIYHGTKNRMGFRPLTGILFFNNHGKEDVERCKRLGFRPLTGILFFNNYDKFKEVNFGAGRFPSPYGDFVFQQELS